MLDLGAGEGYVGLALARALGARVTLADVLDFHQVPLPFVRLSGGPFPFATHSFDVVVLAYVLHHAHDAERLVREAQRVASRVVILESIYLNAVEWWTLDTLDRVANRLRSAGAMIEQEKHLHFRTHEAWRACLSTMGTLTHAHTFGRWPHRQALYVLDR